DTNASDLLQEVLRAGRDDVPSPERLGKIAGKLAGILDAPPPPSPGGGGGAAAPVPPAAPVAPAQPLPALPAPQNGPGVLLAAGIGAAFWALGGAPPAGSAPGAAGVPAPSASIEAPEPSGNPLPVAAAAPAPSDDRAPIRVEDLPDVTDEKEPAGRGAAS